MRVEGEKFLKTSSHYGIMCIYGHAIFTYYRQKDLALGIDQAKVKKPHDNHSDPEEHQKNRYSNTGSSTGLGVELEISLCEVVRNSSIGRSIDGILWESQESFKSNR